MVTLTANANLRAGPGTAYPVIGGAHVGQTLRVTGQGRLRFDGGPQRHDQCMAAPEQRV